MTSYIPNLFNQAPKFLLRPLHLVMNQVVAFLPIILTPCFIPFIPNGPDPRVFSLGGNGFTLHPSSPVMQRRIGV